MSCAKLKAGRIPIAPLGELPETSGPMEMAPIDICGPYPITQKKNRYLLTYTDHFTRYPEAIPIPNQVQKPLPGLLSPKCSLDTVVRRYSRPREGLILRQHFFKRCVSYYRQNVLIPRRSTPRCRVKLRNFILD